MNSIHKGLCWAGAILLNAAGNYFGLIDDKTAEIMLREAVASYREAAREAGVERYFGIWRERGESGE